MRRGKKYAAAAAKYDKQKRYELNEAVKLVKEAAFAKFDETVELSVKLNLKKGQKNPPQKKTMKKRQGGGLSSA